MRTTLLLLLLLTGCFSLTGEGYRTWLAERYAPARLLAERLVLEFAEESVRVCASFLFRTEVQSSIVCCFPGKGYPVRHGLPGIPVVLPTSPERMEVSASQGAGLTLDSPAEGRVPVYTRTAGDGISHGFQIDFTNAMTRVDIRYENRWEILPDGRRMFVYILTSGARWRGPIGSLTVIERGRRKHGVTRAWPRTIPGSRVEPDFDLVYFGPVASSGDGDRQ